MEHVVVRSGRADLAVTVWGAAGPAILALHPGVGDRRIWQWCAPPWAEAGHRVIAHDRRGFGSTAAEAEPHDDLADLLAVTAATDARPAVIVGNSRGGGLALDLALAHPEHVRGLVLVAPSPSGFPEADWVPSVAEEELDTLLAAAEEADDPDLVNRLEVRYWLDGVDQPDGRVSGPARDLMLEMNGRALRADPIGEDCARPPVWPRLGEIAAPTLVVVGAHDLPGYHVVCEALVTHLPHAALVTLPESAHCPSLDDPAGLDRVVLGFLRQLAP